LIEKRITVNEPNDFAFAKAELAARNGLLSADSDRWELTKMRGKPRPSGRGRIAQELYSYILVLCCST
jgi:hypothetical protein